MSNEFKKKGKMYDMYGNYVPVPYTWYGLCRKYIIPKEVKEFKDKKENSIELNPMEINVLAYLANYDDCYAANGTIAEVFKLKKKTIEKYMRELRWVGFIKTFENKEYPTYTDRRNIFVQHDAIQKVLDFKGDIYKVPYECGVSNDKVPSTCNQDTLQMLPNHPTDVTKVPSTCGVNKKGLENIKLNYNKELANAQTEEEEDEDKRDLVISCFQKGMSYRKDKPEIQNYTGLSGKVIYNIIQDYYKEEMENANKTRIPLSNGMMSDCYVEQFNIKKETLPVLYPMLIEEDGEYKFKKEFVDAWLLKQYGYVHNA